MRRSLAFLVLLLAGCRDTSADDKTARDQRDIALVEKANNTPPPVEQVVPEPIGAPDLERFDISGPACNYAPGTSFGTLVIARKDDAFMKIRGKVQRFAADPGSNQLQQGTHSLYNSREFVLKLDLRDGQKTPGTQQSIDYEGAITLLDPHGRAVFEGSGLARCNG